VIISDDVGISNISAYSMGLAGYQTPNLDRLAKEGVLFTDYLNPNLRVKPVWVSMPIAWWSTTATWGSCSS